MSEETQSKLVNFALRFAVLMIGLVGVSLGLALTVHAGIGAQPWTVFHQGIAGLVGLSIGRVTQVVGFAILTAAFLFFRQKPGFGTVMNMVFVGFFVDFFLAKISGMEIMTLPTQLLAVVLGVLIGGVGVGVYISASLGAGPRDGLMLGLSQMSGKSIRFIRTAIELTVLIVGFFLGGTVGIGTVVSALGMGPVVQFTMRSIDGIKGTYLGSRQLSSRTVAK